MCAIPKEKIVAKKIYGQFGENAGTQLLCTTYMRGPAATALLLSLLLTNMARGETNDDIQSASLFPCGSGSGCSPLRQEVCLLSIISGQEQQEGVQVRISKSL